MPVQGIKEQGNKDKRKMLCMCVCVCVLISLALVDLVCIYQSFVYSPNSIVNVPKDQNAPLPTKQFYHFKKCGWI